jgi:hypothetical protein
MKLPEPGELSVGTGIACDSDTAPSDIVRWLANTEASELRILIPNSVGEAFERNFPLNSQLRGLAETTEAAIRVTTTEPLPNGQFGESVSVMVAFGGETTAVSVTETAVAEQLNSQFDAAYADAEPLALDIPPWTALLDQLATSVGRETRTEFERLIQAAQIESLGALDEVSVALIAAAHSGALMYDVSRWGEEIGLASKATFSRRKSILENDGVIYTTKVPQEVGRPRLRLHLASNIEQVTLEEGELDMTGADTGANLSDPSPDTSGESARDTNEDGPDEIPSSPSDGVIAAIEEEIEAAIRSE